MTLLKPGQLASLQRRMNANLDTSVLIERVTFDEDEKPSRATVATVLGWIHQVPFERFTQDGGVIMAMTDVLSVPVGTDIETHDIVTTPQGNSYVVVDTTDDETYPLLLQCTIRSRS